MMRERRGRERIIRAAAAVVLGALSNGWAAISFDAASRITITHDADLANAGDVPFSTGSIAVSRSSLIYPVNPYQLDNTFTSGASSSDAFGSLGHVTNSTTASFALATGTGVLQSDPDEVYIGASSLKFDVNTAWNVTSGGFGPLANGFATLTTGGVVGAGGSAELHINLSFLSGTGAALRTPWIVDQVWGPGAFTQQFTTSRVLGAGSLASGTRLQVVGTIEFRASNAESPTTLTGLRNEFGGAPPTAIFKPDTAGSWFDSGNWEPANPNEPGLLSIANGVGQRALFHGTTGPQSSQVVSLDSMVTLGTLDVAGNSPHVFNALGGGGFNFSTQAGNAVINMRPVQGNSVIAAPVQLSRITDVITDGASSLNMSGLISGTGGINKVGTGRLILSGVNTHTGVTSVREGTLLVNNTMASLSAPNSVAVFAGGTLGGVGTINAQVVVVSDGHIAPGVDGVGTITLGGVNVNTGSRLDMQSDASGFDRINVTGFGTFNIVGPTTINATDLGGTTEGDYVVIDYTGPGLDDATVYNNFSVNGGGLFVYTIINDKTNSDIVLRLTRGNLPQWNVDGNGSWGAMANWLGNIPNGTTAAANFLGKITGPRTVTLDVNRTIGTMNFDNANTYTIAGNGTILTVGDSTHAGLINVEAGGNHVISSFAFFGGNSTLNIKGGLTLANDWAILANKSLTKDGVGTLTITGSQSHVAGASFTVARGRVNLNTNAGVGTPTGAILALSVAGNAANAPASIVLGADQDLKALNVDSAVPGTQTFDLRSPAGAGVYRRVRVFATDLDAAKAALYNAIANANAAGAPDPSDGIIDSQLHANSRIGIAKLSSSVLIRPTRIGDLNLDGTVTIADFIDLASHFNQIGTATWQEGDLNYDRNVTIADFIELASNFNASYTGETWPISDADARVLADFAEAQGVPEPGMALLAVGAFGWLGRRGRRSFRVQV
jgi:fibronectin-binding autotransporter adhesin